jgi:hypothetical protein
MQKLDWQDQSRDITGDPSAMPKPQPHTPSKRNFIPQIAAALDAGYRYQSSEMFDWMVSSLLAAMGLPDKPSVPDDAKAQIDKAISLYDEAVLGMPPFMDILGELYMSLGAGKKSKGQFFTPWTVATLLAGIGGHDLPTKQKGELISACDPCCGSGVMMLALCAQRLRTDGVAALRQLSVTCCDIDPLCTRMAAAQLLANCAVHNVELGEIVVLTGNSLLPWKGMSVVLHATARDLPEPPLALSLGRIASLARAARCHPDAREQLNLFTEEEIAA